MTARAAIACLGAGRMGRGIAVTFAYAGHDVAIVDFKRERTADDADRYRTQVQDEVDATLASLARCGLLEAMAAATIAARITVVARNEAATALSSAAVIFEGVPEVLDIKRAVLARASAMAGPVPIIASTTSTILADDLASALSQPQRFLNAHWLNPAYLVPLVELSPGCNDRPVRNGARLRSCSNGLARCRSCALPGQAIIVPRIQALAMNEAARMVEEGVASAADIDKAIKYGFGFRFAVLGMLEFIDWGGGDILYYASRYLTQALGDPRYAAPEIIERNMREGRIGLTAGKGFLDYENLDVDAYRSDRLEAFVKLLNHFGMVRPPVLN